MTQNDTHQMHANLRGLEWRQATAVSSHHPTCYVEKDAIYPLLCRLAWKNSRDEGGGVCRWLRLHAEPSHKGKNENFVPTSLLPGCSVVGWIRLWRIWICAQLHPTVCNSNRLFRAPVLSACHSADREKSCCFWRDARPGDDETCAFYFP